MNKKPLALAALSGLLLAVSFPTVNAHLLAWIALVPLFLGLKNATSRSGFLLGGVTGVVYFAGTVYWITNSVHFYGNIPLIPATLITLLLCAYLALYPALFGACMVLLKRQLPSLLIIAAPAVWTALELARTYVFSGFPWALLGYTQYSVLPVIQISDITGVYGISFIIVFVNTAVAGILEDRKKYIPLISSFAVLAVVLAYGFLQLRTPEQGRHVSISVVQGNIEQDKKWDHAYQKETIDVYKRLTIAALKHKPDLVIWPETAAPFYFSGSDPSDKRMAYELRQFVRTNRTPLLFGSPTYEVHQPGGLILRNSAFLLSADGDIAARYDKLHLVPFGEYVPLKRILFFVEKMVQAIGDFASGTDYTIMRVGDTRISTVICYEIIFPDLVRQFVDRDAGIVTTITNDAWFGKTAAPFQHFSMAVFRAVENRVPVARAANTGVSGFIDAQGHILARSRIFTEDALTHTLTPGTIRTFYTRFGDVFAYLCVVASVVLLGFALRKS